MTIKIGREDAAAATMTAIKKASESNQIRLQTLELAVAHLTNICIGLGEDVKSMRAILMESSNAIRGEGEEAVTEMKLPYYSKSHSSSLSSDSKDDLAIKKVARQPWRKPLAQPKKKESTASPAIKAQGSKPRAIAVKANPKEPMKPAAKSTRPAATASHKGSTGSTKADPIKNMAPAKTNPTTVKGSAGRSIAKNGAGAAAKTAQASVKVKMDASRVSETASREGLRKLADKDVARSKPVNEKGGGRESGSGDIAVKLPPHMADAPTIRSLIYGSRPISVAKSRSEAVPVTLKKRT